MERFNKRYRIYEYGIIDSLVLPNLDQSRNVRELEIASKKLIKLYNLLAIILIIIPEYVAESLIRINPEYINFTIPRRGPSWQESFELRVIQITLRDLREIGRNKGISCYSRMNKEELIKRLGSHL